MSNEEINLKGTTLKELVYDMRKDLAYLIERFDKGEADRKEILNEIKDLDRRLIKMEMKNTHNTKFITIIWSVISSVIVAGLVHFIIKNK